MADGAGSRRRQGMIVAGVGLALTLLGATVLASTGRDQPMSSDEAGRFTRRALSTAGIDAAHVGTPRPSTFRGAAGPVEVWAVPARVRGERIVLYVERRGDQAVNLDDQVGPEEFALTDEEFEALDRFRWDPVAAARRRRMLLPAVAAAVLAVGVGGATVVSVNRRWVRLPSRRSPVE